MDRFFRGFLAGLLGGIPMNMWSLFSYHIIGFGPLRFLDWMGIILYALGYALQRLDVGGRMKD